MANEIFLSNNEKFHVFSKSPITPSMGLAQAVNKSGHTTTTADVWAEDIPWFFSADDKATALATGANAKLNDLVLIGSAVYKRNATEATEGAAFDALWESLTLENGTKLYNSDNKHVLTYHKGVSVNFLTTSNNAKQASNYAGRIFINGKVVDQFVASTDKISSGVPSTGYGVAVYKSGSPLSEGEAETNFIANSYAGIIQFNTKVGPSTAYTADVFEYVGKKLDTEVARIAAAVFGTGGENPDQPTDLVTQVNLNTAAIKTLNGSATEAGSVAKAVADAEGRVKVTTDALAGRIAQLEGIQHFAVEVVDTLPATPVENTIYLVAEEGVAEGTYIEYIAYKPAGSENVVTEKIGSTAIDLSGYTTDAEHEALADRVTALDAATTGRVAVVEGKVSTLETTTIPAAIETAKGYTDTKIATELAETGSIGSAIKAAKEQAIASAEVTITAGSGIVVTPEGKGTTFEIAVSDDVVTIAALTALADTVASNKTELEGKITAASEAASKALSDAVTEIGTTTSGLDTRLQTAEGKVSTLEGQVSALTTGDASVDSKVNAAKSELQGKIDAINTSLESGAIHNEIDAVRTTANAAKAIADTAVQSVTRATGSSELITVTDGTDVTISLSAEVATKTDAANAASTAITTSLAGTADDTIGGAISSAVSGLETKLTTGEGSLGKKVETLEGSVKTITETTIPAAITSAQNGAVATVKALNLTASDTDDAAKVTVTLGGTVETPSITVTTSDIASAQTLAALKSTVETHISEAAGLYLSVEKVDALPADADAKTNKIYLVPVDTEAGRAQNIHTEYIWTNGQWEIIGTTAIDINSLEASAKAAQDAADKAQGEVDAVETKIAEMDADLTVNGISVKQVDGKVTELTESLITASVPKGTTSVVGNIAYVGSEKHVIAPEKFQTAAKMPSTLTSWVADLSNLTNGNFMFEGTGLTTFIGDLSSLTSGTNMFAGCSLTVESVEYIADTLPTVTGPYPHEICLGNTTNAHADAIAEIEHKGWFVAPEL